MTFKYDTIWLEIEQQRAHDQSNCLRLSAFIDQKTIFNKNNSFSNSIVRTSSDIYELRIW